MGPPAMELWVLHHCWQTSCLPLPPLLDHSPGPLRTAPASWGGEAGWPEEGWGGVAALETSPLLPPQRSPPKPQLPLSPPHTPWGPPHPSPAPFCAGTLSSGVLVAVGGARGSRVPAQLLEAREGSSSPTYCVARSQAWGWETCSPV